MGTHLNTKEIIIANDTLKTNNWPALISLMVSAIVFVTAELAPVGILQEMSSSFHKSVGTLGLIVTGYAWTVVLSAVFLTTLFSGFDKRKLLVSTMMLFCIANLIVGFAPNLPLLFAGRILGAFGHGIFWSTVGALCVKLANNSSASRATSIVFGGIAIATVVAVPSCSFMALHLSWRGVFIALSILSFLAAIAMHFGLPAISTAVNWQLSDVPKLLHCSLLRRSFPSTALALTGHFCALTYISVMLEQIIKIPHKYLPVYLFVFGIAGVVGNFASGKIPDKHVRAASVLSMLGIAVAIISSIFLTPDTATASNVFLGLAGITIACWGACICMLTVALQALISTLPDNVREGASAVHVSMFNLGIGGGAFLGSIIVNNYSLPIMAYSATAVLIISAVILSIPFKK